VARQPKTETNLIESLASSEPNERHRAFEEVVHRFHHRLIALVHRGMSCRFRARIDPEDVVMEAWSDFFSSVAQGRFSFHGEPELWQLIVRITSHKLLKEVERHGAARRNVNREEGMDDLQSVASTQPPCAESALLAITLQELKRRLEPNELRILELMQQGYGTDEIATALRVSRGTVQYRLKHIARVLAEALNLDELLK